MFVLLDLAGMHLLLLPYYTGMIAHTSADRVPLASVGQLLHTGIFEFAQRLSANKAAFLRAGVLICLWTLFLAATALLVPLAFRLRRHMAESET